MKALEILKEEILINLENPKHLELLYQKDKTVFKHAFLEIYPMKKEILLVQAWNERLRFQKENISLGSKTDRKSVV